MLIVDGHLDLAHNALQGNRDLLRTAHVIRTQEHGAPGAGLSTGTVALPDMRRGLIALSFATVFARSSGRPVSHVDFATPAQAHGIASGQLAYYHAMERQGHLRIIRDAVQLSAHVGAWAAWDVRGPDEGVVAPPLGIVISMESADSVLDPDTIADWWDGGVRLLGPAHMGPGRYAGGTGSRTGLTALGAPLLREMRRVGVLLDLSHCSDEAFWEALERYDGPVHASHTNCRTLTPHPRQFSDPQIRAIIDRGGVIGVVPAGWFLKPGWTKGDSNAAVTLRDVVRHIDHICALAGNTRHVGIGSDLDGGIGYEGFARDIDTVADLQKLVGLLADRGYTPDDVAAVMHANWIDYLRRAWDPRPRA